MNLKAPFPYFGGKSAIADVVWELLGDVGGYVEPFSGSAAVLLARPPVNGVRVETINDADGLLINTWRAIRYAPNTVVDHLAGLVSEVDFHAKCSVLKSLNDGLVSMLEGDPEYFDAKLAAWWLDVMAMGIGNPFASGPWVRVQDEQGMWRLLNSNVAGVSNTGDGLTRAIPAISGTGRGVNRGIPAIGNAGRGVNRAIPAIGNAGQDPMRSYMDALAERLQGVRIICGDWKRVLKPATANVTGGGKPHVGIFLDPPYTIGNDVYTTTSVDIDADVREWCKTANPDYRIVLAGYDNDHDELLDYGWTKHVGKAKGGGYSKRKATDRERLWASPACLSQPDLFTFQEDTWHESRNYKQGRCSDEP